MSKPLSHENVKRLSENYQNIGQFIRANRLLLGLSQADIAHHSGLTRQTITLIEREKISPNLQTMTRILSYLKSEGAPEFNLYKTPSPASA